MTESPIRYGLQARAALLRGADRMAALAAPTLGPVARTVAIAPILGSDPPEVLDTAETIARAGVAGRTVVEASTLALRDKLAFKEVLEKAGHTALDCPMSGTGAQAAVKDLVVYASGDSGAILRLEPAFLGFARKVFDLGAYGNGSKMKFVANHLVAIHNVAAAEAMVLAMKAGLDPRQTVEVVASGAGTSRVFELRAPMMAANDYLPATMRSTIWKKDLTVIGEFASDLDCPTPLFGLATTLHAAALALGHGAEDSAAVCAALERMAGVDRGTSSTDDGGSRP